MGSIWVLFSDNLLTEIVKDTQALTLMQSFKGIGFVLFSAIMIYLFGFFSEKSLKTIYEALITEESKVKRLMETSPTGIIYVNGKGVVSYSNSVAEDLLFLPPDSLNNMHIDELAHEINKTNARAVTSKNFVISKVLNSKKAIWDKKYNVGSRGDYHLISINASPVLSRNNEIEGILCTIMDVTDIHQASQKGILHNHKERYKLLVDETPFGVLIQEDSIIRFVNPYGLKMLGASNVEDVVGTDIMNLVHPDYVDDLLEYRERYYSGEKKEGFFRIDLITVEGKKIPVEVIIIPFKSSDIDAEQVIIIDISERILKESELERSLEEKKMLLSEMHHRVKNNLAIISGLIQLEAFEAKSDETKSALMNTAGRIKTIALVHEQIYASDNYSDIVLDKSNKGDAENLIRNFLVNHDIDLGFNINSAKFNLVEAMSVALFINEATGCLVNLVDENSRGDKKPALDIDIRQAGAQTNIELSIEDYFKTEGESIAPEGTLSSQIMEIMAEQLLGELDIIQTKEKFGVKLTYNRKATS